MAKLTCFARISLQIIILGILALLSACGQSVGKSSSISHGGSVTIVPAPIGNFNCSFNPFDSGSNTTNCYGVDGLIYEPLIYTNLMTGQSTPWLAEKYTWSVDAKTLTLNLRHNVSWSDGQPFTSADVAYTFDILRRFPKIDGQKVWQFLSAVNTPDTYTVVMNFSFPALAQQWIVGTRVHIAPQHIMKNMSDPTTVAIKRPIGTGPFVLSEYQPTGYMMKRNTGYWQPGKPYVDEVHFPAYSSNTMTSVLFAQNTIDWAGVYIDSIQNTYIALSPAYNHYWFPSNGIVTLDLNLTNPAFKSLSVRQAISLTLNREALVNQAAGGYPTVASPTGLILPGFQSYLDPKYTGITFKQDIQQAKTILANAGYRAGSDGVLVNAAGERLAFTLFAVDGWTDWAKASDLIANQLQAIGIAVTIQNLPFSTYYTQLQTGMFEMAMYATTQGPSPFYILSDMLGSKYTAPIGQSALKNWVRWNDPATDALLQEYQEATDQSEQLAAIKGLEQIMVEQLPVISLFTNYSKCEYSTARFVGWPDESNPYAVPSPYVGPDIEVVLLNIHRP
jgi:peptide/nickel transport system substrate-binding protein